MLVTRLGQLGRPGAGADGVAIELAAVRRRLAWRWWSAATRRAMPNSQGSMPASVGRNLPMLAMARVMVSLTMSSATSSPTRRAA